MKILIVDDQSLVRTSLVNGINWERLGIDCIFQAENVKDAKDKLEVQQVDIMLMDIEMPGENGIMLWEWVRENYPSIEGIFLTAHADFSYAQRAIHLSACDYILQPAPFEKIEEIIGKACVRVERKKQLEKVKHNRNFVQEQMEILINGMMEHMVVAGKHEFVHLIDRVLSTNGVFYENELFALIYMDILSWDSSKEDWPSKLLRLLVCNVMSECFQELPCQVFVSPLKKDRLFIILYGNRDGITQGQMIDTVKYADQFIQNKIRFETAVYLLTVSREGFYEGIKRLTKKAEDNCMRKETFLVDWEEEGETVPIPENMHKWSQYLKDGNEELVRKEITEYCEDANKTGELTLERMKYVHMLFLKALFESEQFKNGNIRSFFTEDYTYDTFMESYHTYEDFLYAVDYCLEMFKKREYSDKDCIEIARQYIQENISQNISRKEVAQMVFLNEDYFSRLFKSKVGMTFKEYVINEKVELAKKLLISTKFSVGIIASKVGYDNFSYFSRIFKDSTGVTPLEYRQKIKDID